MKILAMILIVFSVCKLIGLLTTNPEITVEVPEIIKQLTYAILIVDSLVGLFCGLFIICT